MKIAITGHTKGIGKALAEKFSMSHDVIGFSKSNGYDISSEEARNQILEESKDCSIFINNAYDPIGQTELLNQLIEVYSNSDKLIININSKLSFFPATPEYDQYIKSKATQNKIIKERIFQDSPRLLNVVTGLVDTDMSVKFNAPKVNPADFANLIYNLVQYTSTISIQEIVIDVPGLNWKDIKQHA
jgi:short-subunit dehydrogenase involved in D-alanine esterification of teichoic acids